VVACAVLVVAPWLADRVAGCDGAGAAAIVSSASRHAPPAQVTEAAPLGCYVHGLVLEGAAWDREEGRLKESAPGQLRQQMPVIQVGATL
jgi:hypothetical protein